ncbi:MAG: hypothetical protein HZB91_14795 [Elusimicrobia bacterium]|nr:hypothetical protein [Elusimicrobiota bacterium]
MIAKLFGTMFGKALGESVFSFAPALGLFIVIAVIIFAIISALAGKRDEASYGPPPVVTVFCTKCKARATSDRMRCPKCGDFLPPIQELPPPRRSKVGAWAGAGLMSAILVIAVFHLKSLSSPSREEWADYIPAEEAFSVQMPAKPTRDDRTISVRGVSLDYRMFTSDPSSRFVCAVLYVDFPPGASRKQDDVIDAGLENGIAIILNKAPGKEVARRSTSFHGHDAREFEAELDAGGVVIARGFFHGDRFYTLLYMHPSSPEEPKDRSRFFDRFAFREPGGRPQPDAAGNPPPKPAGPPASPGPRRVGWAQYIPASEPFSVLLPAAPEFTETGEAPNTYSTYRSEAGKTTYIVSYFEISGKDDRDSDHLKERLARAREDLAASLGGVSSEPTFVLIESMPGEEFSILKGPRPGMGRSLKWGNRVFLLAVAYPAGADDPAGRQRFLDSFKPR